MPMDARRWPQRHAGLLFRLFVFEHIFLQNRVWARCGPWGRSAPTPVPECFSSVGSGGLLSVLSPLLLCLLLCLCLGLIGQWGPRCLLHSPGTVEGLSRLVVVRNAASTGGRRRAAHPLGGPSCGGAEVRCTAGLAPPSPCPHQWGPAQQTPRWNRSGAPRSLHPHWSCSVGTPSAGTCVAASP